MVPFLPDGLVLKIDYEENNKNKQNRGGRGGETQVPFLPQPLAAFREATARRARSPCHCPALRRSCSAGDLGATAGRAPALGLPHEYLSFGARQMEGEHKPTGTGWANMEGGGSFNGRPKGKPSRWVS